MILYLQNVFSHDFGNICRTVSCLLYFITTLMMRRDVPPGPFPYPFTGNIPHLFCDPVDAYGKLADKYGDIFTLSFPNGNRTVVLSTASLVREGRLGNTEDLLWKVGDCILSMERNIWKRFNNLRLLTRLSIPKASI